MVATPRDDRSRATHLETVALQLAESQVITLRPKRTASIPARLQECEARLHSAYEYFARASEIQLALSYAAEWILDNFYVVEQTVRQIGEDMPPGYYRQLPKLGSSPLEGQPRIYAVAWELIKVCEHHLDLDQTVRFIRAYQRVTLLSMGELWALPTMLRLGILESLARAVARITEQQAGEGQRPAEVPAGLLSEGLEDEAIVANCMVSLRMLATQDWKTFFEAVSRVERVLCHDPADVYAHMDFDTRDRYRGVVEDLALRTGRDEEEVAWEAVKLARGGFGRDEPGEGEPDRARDVPRAAHVGFYLLDAGRKQLERLLGYHPLLSARLTRCLLDHPILMYLGSVFGLTLPFVLGLMGYAFVNGGAPAQWIGAGLLALAPGMALAIALLNWFVTHAVPPRLLPRLDFQEGIPADCCTMVVIPTLLTDAGEVDFLLGQLELHFLGNTDAHLLFALLTDFVDAPDQHMPEDDALVERAKAGIEALNKKYAWRGSKPFYLFHREREWNPAEGCWMGWERKRGKLAEFNRLIEGAETSYAVQVGSLDALPSIRYVITLDTDTLLPRDSARRLVATLAHPLNRAEFDPQGGCVVAGYTVLQPRVEIKPTSAARSLYARVSSGDTGLDLYTRAVSDVYQDLFGEGIYAGKGIYDVAAFERSLAGRVPDNALLSHDLFEGIHGRAGLVTDVVFYEDYPSHYLANTRRLHRWARGDWQLLPWLLPRVPGAEGRRLPNVLSLLDLWKILDNMRRSFLMPALLLLLIAGWLWLPGSALVWTLIGVLSPFFSVITSLFSVFRRGLRRSSLDRDFHSLRMSVLRWVLALVFLPYESSIMIDAVLTTLVRLVLTRRRLLQWTTAAHTIRLFGREAKLGVIWRQMGVAPLMALALDLLIVLINRPALPCAAPLLFLWIASPYIAHWISHIVVQERPALSGDQLQQLRRLARRTWLYFERFVGPDDQWLPPDHFQEDPLGLVAHRTSPTNMGLHLLSAVAAYDFGYAGALDLVLRLRPTFESMGKLERHRGHFLNWYDTRNLKPLPPRYVSVVDSGNLAACLLALKQGCLALVQAPVLRWQRWQGFLDTLDILAETVATVKRHSDLQAAAVALQDYLEHVRQQVLGVRDEPDRWVHLLARLGGDAWQELERLLIALVEAGSQKLEASVLHDLRIWSERVSYQLISIRAEIDMLLPWLVLLSQPPALFLQPDLAPAVAQTWERLLDSLPAMPRLDELVLICRAGQERLDELQELLDGEPVPPGQPSPLIDEAQDWCSRLAGELYSARMAAQSLLIGLQDLADQAETSFQAMDFGFLFDSHRQVFHIGYNVESGTLDGNYYDLLASEARIASLLAIAKGDVPQSHWLHLSRPVTQVDGVRALLSWGGTMFEYLMPLLLMRSYEGTLLDQSCRAAVTWQIGHARQKGVPWGISESGYYRFDAGMHYQYRGFGVPGLGFRRGLSEDLVIAPYASILAVTIDPYEVMRNIVQLKKLGGMGRYGFYEAFDYTRSRLPADQKSAIVRSYMVHHQGMILLALANYLSDAAVVQRVHADPRVQSVQLLLQEQVPQQVPVEYPHPEEVRMVSSAPSLVTIAPWRAAVDAPVSQVYVLSNGRYGLLITSAGGGYSTWQELQLTRWRADTALDNWGTWIYVRDEGTGDLWSAACQPTGSSSEGQEVLFHAHMAEFRRRDHDISLNVEIVIHPDDDVEIRRVTVVNHGDTVRRLRLVSYGEVVLASHTADVRHSAFGKLFVESEYLPELNALLFRRRPRSNEEEPIHLAHFLVTRGESEEASDTVCDRECFLGRGGTVRSPAFLSRPLAGKEERQETSQEAAVSTLDPIMSLSQVIELKPHGRTQVAYVTSVAGSREEALELVRRYRAWPRIDRAYDSARSRSELELRRLNMSTSDLERVHQLLSVLVFPHAALRAAPAVLAANARGQSGLWAYGISGDYPILVVHVADQDALDLVIELLYAHAYWRGRQIKIDLVIVNERETAYDQELQGQIQRLISRSGSDAWLNQRGGIFLLRADQMGQTDRVLLDTAARVVLVGEKGRLAEQIRRLRRRTPHLPRFVSTLSSPDDLEPTAPLPRPPDLLFDNGLGGFSPDGREYVIYLEPDRWTPSPWVNVVANPHLGFLVSETGLGCTWAENSGENRLTPWNNDPVTDMPGEAVYLRDEETAQIWSLTPMPARAPAPYLIRHGVGYSIFEHHSHGLLQQMRLFAAPDAPVKIIHVRLQNTWNRTRRITMTFFAEWVLGVSREFTQQHIISEFDAGSNTLLARNPYQEEFGERVAFVTASKRLHGLTADRIEFLGRRGSYAYPAGLERIGLSGTVRAGLDSCAALQVHLDMGPGDVQEEFFLLGQGADRRGALRLVEQYRDAARVETAWREVNRAWDGLLGAIEAQTPDPAMNILLNRWLLYQALSCRVWGRSALYQSSGAFGYRDQLQDVMALVYAAPDIARKHILEAARRQFEQGDVLHWWHPPSGRGVRTRCSDDLLWLPYVTSHYVTVTGDEAILNEEVPFLGGDPLEQEEVERYGHYLSSGEHATLYEHCRRALEKGTTAGPHELPLIGGHDWNDGMNRVGIQGKGESVWLGWFLYDTLNRFIPLCERLGDQRSASLYRHRMQDLRQALEDNAWDWGWYRRAYYDDGIPLGSSESRECQIDSIAQSWAVLSGAADPKRARRAMEAVADRLVRRDEQLVLIFVPPFDRSERDPGYIKGYPPGIRENGGQYTHAALWVVWAFVELGQGDDAEMLFRLLNPIYHGDDPEKMARYRVEPYVVAADVYSVPPHVGRGGWTWYTGSAGWMYRLGMEAILGFRKVGDALRIHPCIPKHWSSYSLTYRFGGAVYRIRVENPDGVNQGVKQITLDGEILPGEEIPLLADGLEHDVLVSMVERRYL